MMMVFGLLALIGAMAAWPDAPAVRVLRRVLVEPLADGLNGLTGRRGFAWLCVAAALGLAFLLFEAEGLRLMAAAAPELAAWLTLVDAAVMAEAMAAAAALAAARRWAMAKSAAQGVVSIVIQRLRRPAGRARSARPATARSRPDKADDPEPFGWAQPMGAYRPFSIA